MSTSFDWTPLLQRVQLHVVVSWRLELRPRTWQLDLQSPFWRLYVNDRSGAHILHEGARLELRPDHVYVIPAWVRFQTGTSKTVVQDFLHFYLHGFPPPLLRQLFDRPGVLPIQTPLDALVAQWRAGLGSASENESKELLGNKGVTDLTALAWSHALAHAGLAQYVAQVGQSGALHDAVWWRESTAVWPALQHIEARLAAPPTNAELAALCHLSPDHFIRQFRHVVGSTPAQYGLERRIEFAAHQLVHSSQTIEQIATATGFADRFHFSKVFKQRLHTPPVAYRKAHRHGS